MGPFDRVSRGFAATIFPASKSPVGARPVPPIGLKAPAEESVDLAQSKPPPEVVPVAEPTTLSETQQVLQSAPFFGASLHNDGVPSLEIDPETGYYGPHSAVTLGTNRTPLFME